MNTAKEILRKHCEAFSRDNFGVKYDPDSKANDAILAAMAEHTDLHTKALQEENRQLLEWKRQQLEVWGPVDDWAQKNPDIKVGQSKSKFVLKTLQEHQQLKERARMLLLFIESNGKPVDGYRFREEAIKLREALTAYQTTKNEG